jgi:hypothetical protein
MKQGDNDKKEEKKFTLNGNPITEEELEKLQKDSSIKIKKISENEFKKLNRLEG